MGAKQEVPKRPPRKRNAIPLREAVYPYPDSHPLWEDFLRAAEKLNVDFSRAASWRPAWERFKCDRVSSA